MINDVNIRHHSGHSMSIHTNTHLHQLSRKCMKKIPMTFIDELMTCHVLTSDIQSRFIYFHSSTDKRRSIIINVIYMLTRCIELTQLHHEIVIKPNSNQLQVKSSEQTVRFEQFY